MLKKPKTITENTLLRLTSKSNEDEGDYEAQDIDFKTTRLTTRSINSNGIGQMMTTNVNVAIESVDIVSYCNPKDSLPTD